MTPRNSVGAWGWSGKKRMGKIIKEQEGDFMVMDMFNILTVKIIPMCKILSNGSYYVCEVSVQLLSRVQLLATSCDAALQTSIHHLLELAQTQVSGVSDAI